MSYTLIESREVNDIQGTASIYKHNETGATVVTLKCDDPNKTITIGFRTPVNNSKGIPHILEHSVLEGSKKYPLKDPFVQLMKGSLNTFLNAMTYDEFTLYPVASLNDQDFKTLMDVYLDATFFPLVMEKKEIFMQEGWHYEKEEDGYHFNGVVFNEMKGEAATADFALSNAINKTLCPNTKAYVSGGVPSDIVDLSYEELKDFYKAHYNPANSIIILYGNQDMDERLAYLEDRVYSHFEKAEETSYAIEVDFDEVQQYRGEYPSQDEDLDNNEIYTLAWRFDDHNIKRLLAIALLDGVLIEANSGAIKRALLDLKIGEEVSSWLEDSSKYPSYSIVLRKANKDNEELFFKTIYDTLNNLKEKGLDEELVASTIHTIEYSLKEADYGRTPKGLSHTLSLLKKLLYHEDNVLSELETMAIFDEFKEDVKNGCLMKMIDELLVSTNSAKIILSPSTTLLSDNDEKLKDKENERLANLNEYELKKLEEEFITLNKYREEEDTAEDLACIPLLKREELKDYEDTYPTTVSDIDGIKFISNDLYCNDISYIHLCFDLSSFTKEEYLKIGIIEMLFGNMDTLNYSYDALNKEVGNKTGGINSSFEVYRKENQDSKAAFVVGARYFKEESKNVLRLILEITQNTLYKDKEHLKELLQERLSIAKNMIAYRGNAVVREMAGSCISETIYMNSLLSGNDFYRYISKLLDNYDELIDELLNDLDNLSKRIFTKNNLILFYTGKDSQDPMLKELISSFEEGKKKEEIKIGTRDMINLGLSYNTQVNYCSLAGKFKPVDAETRGHLLVLAQILNTNYLWQNIRVLGGAYGAGVSFAKSGVGIFTTYRDPQIENSFKVFKETKDFVEKFDVDENVMRQYVIGTMNAFDEPLSNKRKGINYNIRYLNGTTKEEFDIIRKAIINCQAKDIRALYPIVEEIINNGICAILGSEDKLQNLPFIDKVEPVID